MVLGPFQTWSATRSLDWVTRFVRMSRLLVIEECGPESMAYGALFLLNCCVRYADMSIGDVKVLQFNVV
jgi:hypothetical protein